jgi:exodeoxyribonuclease VII large subunit
MQRQDQRRALSVTQLLQEVKRRLEPGFQDRSVVGEVSNLKLHSSGNRYFTLKDVKSQVSCMITARYSRSLDFTLEEGLRIVVEGSLQLYPERGQLQLLVRAARPDGLGQFYQMFEQLKQKLRAEGLFEEGRKRPLPYFPRRVLLITSAEGAVLHDLVDTFRRRNPCILLSLCPVPVQGEEAAAKIIESLQNVRHHLQHYQCLVLARGGGSLTDLWTFNREQLVRYLVTLPIPFVSAIGHETDFTLVDMVADRRAATPTAAAELLSPSRESLLAELEQIRVRMSIALERRVEQQRSQLRSCTQILKNFPRTRLEQEQSLRLRLTQQLSIALNQRMKRSGADLRSLQAALQRKAPLTLLQSERHCLDQLCTRLDRAIVSRQNQARQELVGFKAGLNALSPLKILDRGYAICLDDAQRPIQSASSLKSLQRFYLQFHDGKISATVAHGLQRVASDQETYPSSSETIA